jgi:hypothetical protein
MYAPFPDAAGRLHTVVWTFALAVVGTWPLMPGAVDAQAMQGRGYVPTVSVGASTFLADFMEDHSSSLGVALRAGIRARSYELFVSAEHWGSVKDYRITSAVIEWSLVLGRRAPVRTYLLVGLGHTWSDYHGPFAIYDQVDGTAAILGPGMAVTLRRSVGVEFQALLRTDDGGYNMSLRGLGSWSPEREASPATMSALRGGPAIYWMAPLSGPWRFVEPGFGLRFTRAGGGTVSPTVAFAVFHWQIPGQAFLRDYIWDTRAFLALPGAEWRSGARLDTTVRLGPALTVMGEGPGNGANVGTYVEATVSPEWAGAFFVGAGWMWMPHDGGGDPRVSDIDQHGLMISAGVSW